MFRIKLFAYSTVSFGFGNDVAALSR
jgi:hypothetical protein